MLKAIDFFCGGGGMTYGLKEAGINVIAGIDIDSVCKETYEYNNPNSTFINEDIKKLPLDFFEKKMNISKNDDSLIMVGCSPCQFYSIINSKKDYIRQGRDLLLDFQRFIEYYKPGYIVIENVPGIQTNKKTVLHEFLHFLDKNNYKFVNGVFNLSDYGVPQSRKRYTLLASRVSEVNMPKKENKQIYVKDVIGVHNGFPTLKAGEKYDDDKGHIVAGLSEKSLRRLSLTPHNGGSRDSWSNDEKLQLTCFKGRDESFRDTYGRMSWDKLAPTITTKFTSISNGRFGHPEENRALSIREGAALQTFPDSYLFKASSIANKAKMIGNAVPPLYAKKIGKVIRKSYEKRRKF